MVKKKKQVLQGKDLSHGRMLVYLVLVVAALFLVTKLDISGMAAKKTTATITPTILAGSKITVGLNPGPDGVKQQADIYRKDRLFCQGCIDIPCGSSRCTYGIKFEEKIPDNWETGEYSIRFYDGKGTRSDYAEVFFDVEGIYPETDDIKEVQVHR